jgi:predicted permease
MSLWSRLVNVFRGERLSREIDEEMESHIAEALAEGRDAAEANLAFGSALRHRESSRDLRLIPWLDSLRQDAVFGWRQLRKNRVTSAAAILSLGLAFGACTAAFRLIDALLLRPLPIHNPDRLYVFGYDGIAFDGSPQHGDSCEYPMFRQMVPALQNQADLLAISYASPSDLTYGSDEDMERPYLQYISGRLFDSFGIRPAVGRVFTENDDLKPGAHPYAVLSYDYWTRRFGRDRKVIGRSFRLGNAPFGPPSDSNVLFTIVGVAGRGFTGVEPGAVADVWVPAMMNPSVNESNSVWFRTFVHLKPGVAVEPVREKLGAVFQMFREERAKTFVGWAKQAVANFLSQRVSLEPAVAGVSVVGKEFRGPLAVLAGLVALVLLIACANVANLMTAQAAARAREMALRVSIGAGRARLVQLVLMEGAILAVLAAASGGIFAWWAAPFVAGRIHLRNNPVRLDLPADWRVVGFGLALTLAVMLLFGLAPALRASAVTPANALKGRNGQHARGRLMQALVVVQAAFCFVVLFAGELFVTTFERLSGESTGFSPERLLALEVIPRRPESPDIWNQVVEQVRAVPGVASAALSRWAPLSGAASMRHVSIDGGAPSPEPVFALDVMPGWFGVMKIPLIAGRDFGPADTYPQVAVVNESFAKRYFPGQSPIGKVFGSGGYGPSSQIVGVIRNARYDDMRGAVPAVVYGPFRNLDSKGALRPARSATLMVRTASADPFALESTLRKEVARARPGFRVSNVRTEEELVEAHTVRERLLATLAVFFAAVALLLAGIGLYGVLDYSVVQRRREIGIRMAIGARASDIVWRVAAGGFAMVLAGAVTGLALGLSSARYVQTLLYEVKATDPSMIAVPWLVLLPATLLATVPAVVRAIRTDPMASLRAE